MNRLAWERSPYLRHAAHQKINWYPWCEDAFEKAKTEDKPIFLSSGAVWCHWCHVMARQCFDDDGVAGLLNENFVSIKLDRDERPDIDRRYQQAVAAMGLGSGWPLSVFLTYDKRPFYGGTYFPLHEGLGRPGFKTILRAVNELYRTKKDEIIEHSRQFVEMLKTETATKGDISLDIITTGVKAIELSADKAYGGFGHAPKFPMSGAIEFLLNRYHLSQDEQLSKIIIKTLISMAKGGIHDQLAGGFHRYSTDMTWTVPHFEKILDDNVWLLRNYIDAYNIFKDESFRAVALNIIDFFRNELSDDEGGFYASQDADVKPDDEGGYFTWSAQELKEPLDEDEYRVLSFYYLHDKGGMHHNPEKKVLFVSSDTDVQMTAKKLGITPEEVELIIDRGRKKLLEAREKRQKPFIDKTIYTSLNGMAISAFLKAYMAFRDDRIKSFALKSLERVIKENAGEDGLFHSAGVQAMLDDYIHLTDALISAYEVTGDNAYLARAEGIMKTCIERLWDKENGGFFDTEDAVLGIRLKGIDDAPHPSANSLAAILLVKLAFLLKDEGYRHYAEDIIRAFSYYSDSMGVHGGYFFCAVDAYYHMLEITVNSDVSSEIARKAISIFYPYKTISYGEDTGTVTLCYTGICHEPISNPENLDKVIKQIHRI